MRILVAADDEARRAMRVAALERLEVEVAAACNLARLAYEVRVAQPDVLLLDGLATAAEARSALKRARGAAERTLGSVLLMVEGATWLRVPLPLDAQPAVVLASAGLEDAALRRALERVWTTARVASGAAEAYGLTLDRRSHEARTEYGRVQLTPSEAGLLEALLERPSQVVRHDEIARALYGRVLTDPHTRSAIRGHVASLRRKLEVVEAQEQLQGLRGIGYRFVEPQRRRRTPPRR